MRSGETFVAALVSVVVASALESTERKENFSCCPTPKVKFNRHCEHELNVNNKNFAWLKKDDGKCVSPCKKIDDGLMVLDRCTNVVDHMTCSNKENVIEDVIVHLHGVSCSSSASNKMAATNLVGVLLTAIMMGII